MDYPLYELKVLMFLQNSEGEYLFTDNSHQNSIIKDYVNPPGGHIETGENIEETTRREMKEEMGINNLEDIKLKGFVNVFGFKDHPVLMFVVTAKVPDSETPVMRDEGKPVWIDLKSEIKYKMFDDVKLLIGAIGGAKGKEIFNAISYFEDKKLVDFRYTYV